MAQLPSPAVLLDRRPRGRHLESRREAAAVAADDQRADPAARGLAGPEAVSAPGPLAGDDRRRTGGLPLRRRDLRHRPRAARNAARTAGGTAAAARHRGRQRGPETDCLSPAAAGGGEPRTGVCRLPRGQRRAADDAARDACPGRRHRRHTRTAARAGQGVQPPARGVGHRLLRTAGAGGAVAASLSPFAERRAAAPAHRQRGLAP